MKKMLLLIIATSSSASLMGTKDPTLLSPPPAYAAPMIGIPAQYQHILNDQDYQNKNVYVSPMVQNPDVLEQEPAPIIMSDSARTCVRYGLPALLSAISLIPIPVGCIRDTMCLPCDRTENPPRCFPETKLLCFFLTCGSCGEFE
jgi:hypothetical protein